MNEPDAIFVLYPNQFGELDVVAVGDIMERLASDRPGLLGEDADLDDLIGNCSIDAIKLTPEAVAKVRQLNLTQNSDAYWGIGK